MLPGRCWAPRFWRSLAVALDPVPVQHLIFDLDDTLVDTLGFLVQPAINEACQAMIDAGLKTDLQACKTKYDELFRSSPRQNIYSEIVQAMGVQNGKTPEDVAQAGVLAFYDREIKEDITPFPGTVETLEKLRQIFSLHLVTFGTPKTQRKKIDLLKIGHLFSDINIVDVAREKEKKSAFKKLLYSFPKLEPKAFVSIGNRIDSEIRCGKELKMQTILMLHGEYLHLEARDDLEIPDACIEQIPELLNFFKSRLGGKS